MNKLIEMNKEFPMEANLAIHLLQQEVMELQAQLAVAEQEVYTARHATNRLIAAVNEKAEIEGYNFKI